MTTSIVARYISLEDLFEKAMKLRRPACRSSKCDLMFLIREDSSLKKSMNVRNSIEELPVNEFIVTETFVLLDALNLVEKLLSQLVRGTSENIIKHDLALSPERRL